LILQEKEVLDIQQADIPKQLPKGFTKEQIQQSAKNSAASAAWMSFV